MNSLVTRTITGIAFTGTVLFAVLFSYWTLGILLGLIALLCAIEFSRLFETKMAFPSLWIGAVLAGMVFSIGAYWEMKPSLLLGLLLIPTAIGIYHLFSKLDNIIFSIGISFFAWLYITLPLTVLLFLTTPSDSYNPVFVWGLLTLVWTNDSLAYLTGSLIGKNKMWEKWSPKKTWEGFFGGLIFTIVAGYIIHYFTETPLGFWIIAAPFVSIVGTLGDYFESMIKRQLKIKDSGNWLPGHGGMLDRFDNLLMVAPGYFVIYIFYLFL